MHRIGILEMAAPDPERLDYWRFFVQGLGEHGLVESRHVALDYRWANGFQDRLKAAACELVSAQVDVIVTAGTPAAAAAIAATSQIPIVMATGVSLGTELSGSHAPGNVTGISDLPKGVSAQRLHLLREMIGAAAPLAILADRANPSSPLAVSETRAAAAEAGFSVKDHWLGGPEELGVTLATMRADSIGGFVVAPGAMFFARRSELATCALQYRLATMAVRREYVQAGCLMAYGAPLRENYRQAAALVSRILAGTKPSEIPIAEPTAFDFVINRATARALGLIVPPALLGGAEIVGD
ncbi:MAG: ABC transporter substrate-binding protein [Hyphomicrobiales bacterium]|nr:ABC transporter substrate-binding protein [Hyphomicrobiales bacterium]